MKTLFIALTFAVISPAFASSVKNNNLSKYNTHSQMATSDIGDDNPPKDGEKPKG